MATRLDLETRVYKLLNENSDSTTYDNPTVRALINEVSNAVCEGDIVSLIDNRVFKAPFLRFLAVRQFLKTTQKVISPAIAITDTEITISTTYFASSGYIEVNGDIIKYTGKTATQLTGVSGIGTSHKSGSDVRQAYLIPSTANKGFTLKYYVNGVEKIIPILDDRAVKDKGLYYSLLINDTTDEEFIVIYGMTYDNENLVFDYYKNNTDLTAASSVSDIPNPYALQIIPALIAGEILYYTDEQQKGLGYLRMGYTKLLQMYNKYATKVKEYRKKVKRQSFDMTSVGR